MPAADLSSGKARRIVLAAQGFDRPRPRGRVGTPDLRRTIRQLGVLEAHFGGDRLVARVDLKAERPLRRLHVLSAYAEPRVRPGPVAEALASELKTMASWLRLDSVAVDRRGDLARSLSAALRA